MKFDHLSKNRTDICIFALFTLLSLAMTRPLILKFTTSIPGWVFGDNAEYLWKLWWFKHALIDLRVWPLFSPHIYHPYGFNLAYGEITPTNTLLTLPITAVFGEVVTYNLLALLSFVLSGFAMYLLVCYLTGNHLAGVLSGTIFAYCPYRYTQLGAHLPLMGTQWMVFFFFFLEKLLREKRIRFAILAALAYSLNALSSWYYALAVAFLGLIYLLVRVRPWQRYLTDRNLRRGVILFTVLVAVVVGPFTVPYWRLRATGEMTHSLEEVDKWSASPSDYFIPNPLHPLWGRWVRAHIVPSTAMWVSMEFFLSWGFVATLLAIYALGKEHSGIVNAFGLMALLAVILSLGTTLHFAGRQILLPLPAEWVQRYNTLMDHLTRDVSPLHVPYSIASERGVAVPLPALALYLFVPTFGSMREWSRFGLMAAFAVAILAGMGFDQWMRREVKDHYQVRLKGLAFKISLRREQVSLLAGVIFTLLILFEFWTVPFGVCEVKPRPIDLWLAQQPGDFAVMQFPYGAAVTGAQMYYTKFNGKKIASGYGTYFPATFMARADDLEAFPALRSIKVLREWGIRYALVNLSEYKERKSVLLDELAVQKQLRLVTTIEDILVYEVLTSSVED
jgi:hypothetical protein